MWTHLYCKFLREGWYYTMVCEFPIFIEILKLPSAELVPICTLRMTLATSLPLWGFSNAFDFWLRGIGENGISWSLNGHLSYKIRKGLSIICSYLSMSFMLPFLWTVTFIFLLHNWTYYFGVSYRSRKLCHYYDHFLNLSCVTVYGVCNCRFLFNWDLFELSSFPWVTLCKVFLIPR